MHSCCQAKSLAVSSQCSSRMCHLAQQAARREMSLNSYYIPHKVYVVAAALSNIWIISSTIYMKQKYIFYRVYALLGFQAPSHMDVALFIRFERDAKLCRWPLEGGFCRSL